MSHRAIVPSAAALLLAMAAGAHVSGAQAATVSPVSVFATGAAVGGTNPDSITLGDNSVWVEYGNTADSAGGGGSSTIVRYSTSGAVQHSFTISGSVDGLKVDPQTGLVWALQNNDGNSTLSLIDPTTNTVSSPLSYAVPPYAYGAGGGTGRGYDDVAFLGSKVFLSYTNPSAPTDPILQQLDQGHNPTGTLTTTDVLLAGQTGTLPDTDSLKSTPDGKLILTAEGDGPGSGSTGLYSLISNPGTPGQTVQNVTVTDASGTNVKGMDDIVLPGADAGTLYVVATKQNAIYSVQLGGLDAGTPIASLAGFPTDANPSPNDAEIGLVDPTTGVASPLLTAADFPGDVFSGPHGLAFAVPEPASAALAGLGLLLLPALRRRRG